LREIEFIENETILQCVKTQKENQLKKDDFKYNLFTLSSYNNQLENFHSDIIASFLNTNAPHKEGRSFTDEFLKYLNAHHNLHIPEFIQPIVFREKGRIDIWILDDETKSSIIIENKMNNAVDRYQQIDDYYNYAIKGGYSVCGIIYLSLDGNKFAPTPQNNEAKLLIRNIAAFDNSKHDLATGWLTNCLELCTNDDSKTLIYQYLKLIKYLSNKSMEKQNIERFYELANDKNSLELIDNILKLKNSIPGFRADKIVAAIGSDYPFRNYFVYQPHHRLYDNYIEDNVSFKLDISFWDNGTGHLFFWIPLKANDEGQELICNKLKSIDLGDEFIPRKNNIGFEKLFELGENFKSMQDIDKEMARFVKAFMQKLSDRQNQLPL